MVKCRGAPKTTHDNGGSLLVQLDILYEREPLRAEPFFPKTSFSIWFETLTKLIKVCVQSVCSGDGTHKSGFEERGPFVGQTPQPTHIILKHRLKYCNKTTNSCPTWPKDKHDYWYSLWTTPLSDSDLSNGLKHRDNTHNCSVAPISCSN